MSRTSLLALAALLTCSVAGSVDAAEIGFSRVSSNSADNVESQLCADLTVSSGTATFTFTNNVGTSSSITDIYFRKTLESYIDFSSVTITNNGTNFSDGASPPSVPGDFGWGNGPASGYIAYSSDVANVQDGVNSTLRSVSFAMALVDNSTTEDDIMAVLGGGDDNGTLGLHVQSIGGDGDSDWYRNGGDGGGGPGQPVPEPATMVLLGLGAASAGLARRRRKNV